MPQISQLRRFAVPITGTAMVAGMLLVGTPASAAPVTTTFQTACQAKSRAHRRQDERPVPLQLMLPNSLSRRNNSPSGCRQMHPLTQTLIQVRTTTNLSRLKNDFTLPSNASFVSATIVAGTSFNLDGVAPSVIRISDAGVEDANGPYLRISGSNQVVWELVLPTQHNSEGWHPSSQNQEELGRQHKTATATVGSGCQR